MHKQETGFSMLEKQILALHFSGSYITNFEFKKIAQEVGIEVDLADREKMLKNMLRLAKEQNKEAALFSAIANLLQERLKTYTELGNTYENARDIIMSYIQKTRSTIMLLNQRARMNPYE